MKSLFEKLKLLEYLSYVIESAGQTYTGEARSEIGGLITLFEESEILTAQEKGTFIPDLVEAEEYLQRSDGVKAVKCCSGVSRKMWKQVLEELP